MEDEAQQALETPHHPLGRVDDGEMKNYDSAFARLSKSKFRSRFHLSAADRNYIAEKGVETIRSHCEDFIRTRLAPATPPNDGKQTPMRGHPVFKAQHACACCCSALACTRRVRFPMGREPPQGADMRLPREVVARAARGRDPRRAATGHRRFPHGVDRAGMGGEKAYRQRKNDVETKPRLIQGVNYFTNICKIIFCLIDGKTANMI